MTDGRTHGTTGGLSFVESGPRRPRPCLYVGTSTTLSTVGIAPAHGCSEINTRDCKIEVYSKYTVLYTKKKEKG